MRLPTLCHGATASARGRATRTRTAAAFTLPCSGAPACSAAHSNGAVSATSTHCMKNLLLFLLGFLSWQMAFCVELLESGTSLASPDSRWEVSSEKEDSGDYTSRLFI